MGAAAQIGEGNGDETKPKKKKKPESPLEIKWREERQKLYQRVKRRNEMREEVTNMQKNFWKKHRPGDGTTVDDKLLK